MSFLKNLFDERFIMHRLKATRFAAVVTALAMALYTYYDMFAHDVIRVDMIVLLGILAVSKLAATVYYRMTN